MLLPVIVAIVIPCSLVFWIFNIFTFIFIDSQDVWQPVSPARWLAAALIPVFIARWGLSRKSLDQSGASAGILVGFVLTFSNFCFLSSLLAFFVSASKVTKFRANRKQKLEADFRPGGQRNWVQVLCNGGVATEVAILFLIEAGSGEPVLDFSANYTVTWLCLAVLGALACSSGDTYASEIGSVLGRTDPRLITSLRRVPRGTNGGVSLYGLVSSVVGGLVIGAAYYIALVVCTPREALESCPPQWPVVVMGGLAGFIGSLIDSYLGAIFQYSGFDEERKVIVERPGPDVTHISGSAILDNHSVNLLASLLTALITPPIGFRLWRGLS